MALAVLVTLAGCSAALDVPDVPLDAESGEHLTFTVDVAVECAWMMPESYDYFFAVAIGGVDAPVVSTDAEQVGETVEATCPELPGETGYTFDATVTLTVVAPDHEDGTYDLSVDLYEQTNVYALQVEDGEETDGPSGSFVANYWLDDAVVYGDGGGDSVPDYVDTRDTRRVTNGYDDADRTTMSFKVGIMRGYLSLNGDGFGGSEITIDTLNRLPTGTPTPDGEVVAAIDVDLPGAKHVADRSMTVRMPVVMNAGDGYDVDALHVAYYDTSTGEWVTAETSVVDRTVGGGYDVAHVEADIPYPTLIAVVHHPTDDGGD